MDARLGVRGTLMSQSLDRGLVILGRLAAADMSLDELSGDLGVHKTTVLRLLRTLEAHRMVQRDAHHRYRLGPGLFRLAQQALDERDVRQVAAPQLRRLNEEHGHTVHLAAYEGGEVVYVDKYDGRHAVRMYSRIGNVAPLHCTAVAKVLLADMPESEVASVIERIDFAPYTANTITDPAAFRTELRQVREQGWAADRAEHETFINCVAAPVRDTSGRAIAAVSISVPQLVLPQDDVLALAPHLLRATHAISAEYGWEEREDDEGEA
jgi:DNA-binding IclR family transcriptional regulator